MKLRFEPLDRFQIGGFVLSLAISVSLIAAKQDTVGSVVVGLCVATLTQLFDLQIRISGTEKRLLDAGSLEKTLYLDEWLYLHISRLVADYALIRDHGYELFRARARDAIVDCHSVVHSMADGQLVLPAHNMYSFGSSAITSAEKSVCAVAAANPDFWRTQYGGKYLLLNKQAISRGVVLTRIFIQPSEDLAGMSDILRMQLEAGIKVYTADRESVPPELIEDYMVVDNRIVGRLELTEGGVVRSEHISVVPVSIETTVRKFQLLLRYASEFPNEE